MLWDKSQQHHLRSEVWWFTDFCNSHCLSQFTASFIELGTKTSIAESYKKYNAYHANHSSLMKGQTYPSVIYRPEELQYLQPHPEYSYKVPITNRSKGRDKFSFSIIFSVNDPSAGSPTETLLRLLLPLGDKVHKTFQSSNINWSYSGPSNSPDHPIGRSDGRCVQRAGT
jgi:hypothetical protein